MSLKWDDPKAIVRGTHISFVVRPGVESLRLLTVQWNVCGKQGEPLGVVKWFGRWRSHSFFPLANTVYEQVCLREIAEFCEELNVTRRESQKAKKRE